MVRISRQYPDTVRPYPSSPGTVEIYLDHVGWFVPEMNPATQALERLGFVLSPFVAHSSPDPEGASIPTGTGNRCAMLHSGFLEALVSIDGVDTPLARQHRAAVGRYVGIHLIAFAVADAEAARARLAAEGFEPLDPVRLHRSLALPETDEIQLSFTVVRVPPEKMKEGRIQLLTHETPEATWHPDLLTHENPFTSLAAVLLCVDDVEAAAKRYGRFLGRAWEGGRDQATITLDRGRVVFATPGRCAALLPGVVLPIDSPVIPAIALTTTDLKAAQQFCFERQIRLAFSNDRWLGVDPTEAMGATIVVHGPDEIWPPSPG